LGCQTILLTSGKFITLPVVHRTKYYIACVYKNNLILAESAGTHYKQLYIHEIYNELCILRENLENINEYLTIKYDH